jgi:hypothetical protein
MMIELLNNIDIATSITQMAIGIALPLFKTFLLSESQFQDSIKLLKEKIIEELCEATLELFNRALNEEIPLRGVAGNQPDLIMKHAKISVYTSLKINRLRIIHKRIELSFTYLIATFILGILFLLTGLIFQSHGYIISVLSLFVIASQIFVAVFIRKFGIEIKKFENL